ncbi:AAA family ATPase [Sphingomonas sp. Tas61C01]|uniref:AAA family ATPase n=1 Tax=Sphingomonas sp. Tas61C01 TaxID=3458297 RepID=UPI00403ED1D3
MTKAAPGAGPVLLPMLDASTFGERQLPDRTWGLDGWEPWGSCILLTGIGAVGKSLMIQQRMTCSAAGLSFLGVDLRPGVSIYVSCEDDVDELHRRQAAINAALGITWERLRGRLFLISLKGKQGKELCTFETDGRMRTTPMWESLRATVDNVGATHVALDNTAHFFTGDEIKRNHVAAFVGLLDGYAEEIGGVVILLGHPNKSGDEFSGSTAWENQVRARLFLTLDKAEDGSVHDPDLRILRNSKPNYSRRGAELRFFWSEWAFRLETDFEPDTARERDGMLRASVENERFLECLAKATAEQRATSPAPSASNYAPRVFAKMPTARKMTIHGFEAAMERLLHLGTIRNGEVVYRRDNRAKVLGLGMASQSAPTPAPTMHEPGAPTRTDPAPSSAPTRTRTCPLVLRTNTGAAPSAGAPEEEDAADALDAADHGAQPC